MARLYNSVAAAFLFFSYGRAFFVFVDLVVVAFFFGWLNRSSLGRRAALGCNSLIVLRFFLLIDSLSSFVILFGNPIDNKE